MQSDQSSPEQNSLPSAWLEIIDRISPSLKFITPPSLSLYWPAMYIGDMGLLEFPGELGFHPEN